MEILKYWLALEDMEKWKLHKLAWAELKIGGRRESQGATCISSKIMHDFELPTHMPHKPYNIIAP